MDQPTTPTPESKPSSSSAMKMIIVVVVIIVLAFAVWQFGLKGNQATDTESINIQPTTGADLPPADDEAMTGTYKDGTYEATGQYQNPAGVEDVNIDVTIVNGVVTEATFVGTPDNATTKLMQNKFNDSFEAEAVGKPVDEINLVVVNGSSLTPKGFMDALTKVKTQAKG